MKARLMDSAADFARLGVQPGKVQLWEDGHRGSGEPGHWEWWYFDCILDDGTAAVIQFFGKGFLGLFADGLRPFGMIKVTLPDGTSYVEHFASPPDKSTFSRDKCDVQIGPHRFSGDLLDYDIVVDPINGLGARLRLHSQSQPYRPGSAYFGFGDDGHDQDIFTWLCVVPRGEVTGTLTIAGKEVKVHGAGYHDHQWGSCLYMKLWNHWTWARQRYDGYTVVLFDLVASESYGFQRFPIFFVQDADGRLVFDSTNAVVLEHEVLEEFHDTETDKVYPKRTRYTFDNGAQRIEYTLAWDSILESSRMAEIMPPDTLRELATAHPHLKGTYARYLATGDLVIRSGGITEEHSGSLIYEFMYPGKTYRVGA